jgi:transcriptional regulator with XRE-family HTH domain
MTLGEKIKIVRLKNKLSQSQLAKEAEIYPKNISRYEQDSSIPSATALKKIADVLQVSVDYLLSENESEKKEIKDKRLFEKFQEIQNMSGPTKDVAITLLDLVIRDYKTQQSYKNI